MRDEQEPDGDIAIDIIGLRPGEKLYEELLIGDNPIATKHERIMKAREGVMPWSALEQHLVVLQAALAHQDNERIRSVLTELVTGYTASKDIVDWVVMLDQSPVPDLPKASASVSSVATTPSTFS